MPLWWHIVKIIIETLFFLGMAGSLIVVILTLVEDFQLIFVKEKKREVEKESNPGEVGALQRLEL